MITHPHMQDQIHNRIDELMNEEMPNKTQTYNWNELLQNLTTAALIIIFMAVGIIWS